MRLLYERHSPALQLFVSARLSDPVEAADVVHDVFMHVWTRAGDFAARSSVRAWLFSIARNKAVDRLRKRSRLVLSEPDDTIADDQPDADSVIQGAQDADRVRGCIAKLSDSHRSAIILAFYEGLSYREIAEVERVAENTVKTRIHHAKKLLLHCLSR